MAVKVGDVVRLKSGGDSMTVTAVEGIGITCQWFNKENELKAGMFPPDALVLGSAPHIEVSFVDPKTK